jgi:hypothetical protein
MSTTVSTQSADLTVTIGPTHADAQLLVSLMNGTLGSQALQGMEVLMAYDEIPTIEQIEADHPKGSNGALALHAIMNLNETLGTFVKQGLLHRGLVYDLYWISGTWERCKPMVLDIRQRTGVDALYENFEALALGQQP